MRQAQLQSIGLVLVIMPLGLLLSGCMHEPLPYSPNYSNVALADPSGTPARTGKGRGTPARARQDQNVLVPDACVTPDVAEQPVYLPSGCANNLNLQLMVEQPRDLVQGRQPGPAAAAPSVRAAQRYLYGATEAERRAGKLDAARDQPTSPSLPQGTRP